MQSKAVIVGIFVIDMDIGAEHFVALEVVVYEFKPSATFSFIFCCASDFMRIACLQFARLTG